MSHNQIIGDYGENLACQFLERHGYTILHRNYQASYKELDIVARKDDFVVFVEVKTRTSDAFGDGVEAVDYHKQSNLRKAIGHYLVKEQPKSNDVRADLITVMIDRASKNVNIKHFEDVL